MTRLGNALRGAARVAARTGAVTAACLAVLTAALAAVTLGATAVAAAGQPSRLSFFRVDVSQYPQVGLVVTAPAGSRALTSADFSVSVGGRTVTPQVRQLSPDDVELAVAPAGGLARASVTAELAAAERFVAGLPGGERTVAVLPDQPGVLSGALSADPAPALLTIAGMSAADRGSTAARLRTALSAFTAGVQARRTIVLAITADQPLTPAQSALFARRLVASGTSLYVLDAASGGAPGYDALAVASGGLATRVASPGGWAPALARIGSSLGEQYYLRFPDARALPGRVLVTVRTPVGLLEGYADLPAHNPVAPPLPVTPRVPAPRQAAAGGTWDQPLVLLAAVLIAAGISYGVGMLAASRRDPRRHARPGSARRIGGSRAIAAGQAAVSPPASNASASDSFFVFLMPCLDEEAVIANSLHRLLSFAGASFVVLVIDDGSDDRTAEIVTGIGDSRVWLLQRRPPEARQGKGEALNAAVRHLTDSGYLDGIDPDRVIAVVVDADGRLDPDALRKVGPIFADPAVGAVQVGVRINNRFRSVLARMQDMEFVVYTEVFQRGRRHIGSVGLGGNGQFMRLSAMRSLGPSPWSRSLAEDLDLGIRMIAAGWRNEYCSDIAVHQQGVEQLRRLIKQRSRWFQGHLQSWRVIPLVLRRVRGPARADLLYHMTSPTVLLIASLLSASFVVSLANALLEAVRGRDPVGWWLVTTYLLTFGPALAFTAVYWSKERVNGLRVHAAIGLAHLYVCYGMMWYAAGWWAVGRTLRGRTGWTKTDRVAETPVPAMGTTAPAPELAQERAPLASLAGHAVMFGGGDPALAGGSLPGGEADRLAAEVPIAGPHDARTPGTPGVRRRRRRPLRTLAVGAAVAAAVATGLFVDARLRAPAAPTGWITAFNGYGSTSVTGSGDQLAVSLAPERTTSPKVSHAALVVTARSYRDFAMTVRLRTVEQLRTAAAGRPKPWEVAWVIWHYTAGGRFYALTLEAAGWDLSKEDPAYPGSERFLASGLYPVFRTGAPHVVGITQVGGRITVSADGHLLDRFTDTQDAYLSGTAGLYTEDARTTFDHIRIGQLAQGGQ